MLFLKMIFRPVTCYLISVKAKKKENQKRKLKTFFPCILKNTDLNNICVSIVFKTITNQKYEEKFFLSFLFQNSKMRVFGGHQIFFLNFFF